MSTIWNKLAQNLNQLFQIVFKLRWFPLTCQDCDETQCVLLCQILEHRIQIGHIFEQLFQINILNTLLLILAHVDKWFDRQFVNIITSVYLFFSLFKHFISHCNELSHINLLADLLRFGHIQKDWKEFLPTRLRIWFISAQIYMASQ